MKNGKEQKNTMAMKAFFKGGEEEALGEWL